MVDGGWWWYIMSHHMTRNSDHSICWCWVVIRWVLAAMQCTDIRHRLTNYCSCGGETVNVNIKEMISLIVWHCLFISFYNVYRQTLSLSLRDCSPPHLLLFLPITLYLYSNVIIFLLIETPTKANQAGVHPVLDLVDVDQIVQVWVSHPLLVLVKSDTNLKWEQNREHPGSG